MTGVQMDESKVSTTEPSALGAASPVSDLVERERLPGMILVGTDGRDATDAALDVAARLAERDALPLELLAVAEPVDIYDRGLGLNPYHDTLTNARMQRLRAVVLEQMERTLGDATGWAAHFQIGQPARLIAQTARLRHAALIVVGLGRHRVADRLFGNEVALQVMRQACAPVLAVAPDAPAAPRTVLVAMDFSPASITVARAALQVLGGQGRLIIAHVKPEAEEMRGDPRWDDIYLRGVDALFDDLGARLQPSPGVELAARVLCGDVARELLTLGAVEHADLIAMGQRGHARLAAMLLGSTTTKLARGASCSVLVAPEPRDHPTHEEVP